MVGKVDLVNLAALMVGVATLAFIAVKHVDTGTAAGAALLSAGALLVTAFRGKLVGDTKGGGQ